ncbi:Sec-independent protein translocase protein TatB [Neorhizobium sp. NPDC001467]|uniref:Sec-independent protein translocase protein TatB n=1 Tax=Neorhizobium sp. NPDC001467 TaxID=3390595 RepID=UPI003D056C16
MLDIGWTELLVIAVVMIVVVGPKDLPPMLRAFGKMTSNLRKMAGDFRTQFDEALREADMDDVRKTISDAKSLNPANALRDAINPLRQMGQEIRDDLQKATTFPKQAENGTSADDPMLTGEGTQDADDLADATVPQAATAPVQPAAAAPAAAAPAPATTTPGPAVPSAVPDTLTAASDVPVRKQRAPRAKAGGDAPLTADAPVVSKPRARKVGTTADGSATGVPQAVTSAGKPAKRPAKQETAVAVARSPRAPKKVTPPKDEA